MKRLVLVLSAALAAGTYAAPEKVLELEFADQNAIVGGVGKIGDFAGAPILGPMTMMAMAKSPLASSIGPLRAGARARAVVFIDNAPNTSASTICDVASRTFFVVLYPTNKTKAQFIASKGKAPVKDEGAFVKYDGMAYQFSQDGKWVAFSEVKNANVAKDVLAAAESTRPFDAGDLVRLTITGKGFSLATDLLNSPEVKEKLDSLPNGRMFADLTDVLASLDSLELVLRVTDLGVDMLASCAMKPGSKYEHVGETPLSSATPLAFAGRDSVCASAYGKGLLSYDFYNYCTGLKGIFEKRGVKTDFCDVSKAGTVTTMSFDIPGAIAYFTGAGKDALQKMFAADENDVILNELSSLMPTGLFNQPEQSFSFRVKGLTAYATPSERIARAVPDLGTRKYNAMCVLSLYSIVKGVVGIVADTPVAADSRATIKGVISALPPDTGADIVMLSWREGGVVKGMLRITPAEIRGIGTAVTTIIAMTSSSSAGNVTDDDDDDN